MDVERWAADLAAWKPADEYELVLVGTPASGTVPKGNVVAGVQIPPPLNLNLESLQKQAAFGVAQFLEAHHLPAQDASSLLDVASLLTAKLRPGTPDLTTAAPCRTPAVAAGLAGPHREGLRLIRVFVSAPEDVAAERKVLDESWNA